MISSSTSQNSAKPVKKVSEMNDEELLNEELELTEEELKEFGDDEDLKPYIKVKQEEKEAAKKAKPSSDNSTTSTSSTSAATTTTTDEKAPDVLPPNPAFVPTMLNPINSTARNKLIIATICMFTLPLIGFYYAYYYLLNGMIVSYSNHDRLIWGAVLSVVIVQFVIGGFLYSSLTEEEPELTEEEKKVREKEFQSVRKILLSEGDLKEYSTKAILERFKKKQEEKKKD